MRIAVITFCRDEEKILPWFLRHYDFADEIHIHDNGSTDRSIDIMRSNYKTRIIPYKMDGVDDYTIIGIKNSYYKTINADWFIIVDIDEFIWHPTGVRDYLEVCMRNGIELPQTMGYIMYGNGWPADDGKSQLTDHVKTGIFDPYMYSKFAVVYKTININYNIGAHNCNPTNLADMRNNLCVFSAAADLRLFHYCYVDINWWMNRHYDYCMRNKGNWTLGEAYIQQVLAQKLKCVDATTDKMIWKRDLTPR
jgi:hypothetical protein